MADHAAHPLFPVVCAAITLVLACSVVLPGVVDGQSVRAHSAPINQEREHRPMVTAIQLLPGEKRLLVASDRGLQLYSVESLTPQHKIDSTIQKIYSLKIGPRGEKVAVSGGTPSEVGVCEIYSLAPFERRRRITAFEDVVLDCAWLAESKVCLCSADGETKAVGFDEKQDAPSKDAHSKGIRAIAALSEHQFVTGGEDHLIRVWQQGKLIRSLNQHTGTVFDLAWRPEAIRAPSDAKAHQLPMLASCGGDRTVRLWQPTIGRLVKIVRLDAVADCIAWTPDGAQIIAGCRDGRLRWIDPTQAAVVKVAQVGNDWIYDLAVGDTPGRVYVGGADGVATVELKADRGSEK